MILRICNLPRFFFFLFFNFLYFIFLVTKLAKKTS
uniref:Uncharacterized protein n=1 Tax=Rhizophora mucronata TaxID=61149 RepID=A0A2P2PDP2_RHIMU